MTGLISMYNFFLCLFCKFSLAAFRNLRANSLTGWLPRQWSALSELLFLELAENDFVGTLPENWSTMTNLNLL